MGGRLRAVMSAVVVLVVVSAGVVVAFPSAVSADPEVFPRVWTVQQNKVGDGGLPVDDNGVPIGNGLSWDLSAAVVSPGGSMLYVADNLLHAIRRIDLFRSTTTSYAALPTDGRVTSLAWGPDGKQLFVGFHPSGAPVLAPDVAWPASGGDQVLRVVKTDEFTGSTELYASGFWSVTGLAARSGTGELFVLDHANDCFGGGACSHVVPRLSRLTPPSGAPPAGVVEVQTFNALLAGSSVGNPFIEGSGERAASGLAVQGDGRVLFTGDSMYRCLPVVPVSGSPSCSGLGRPAWGVGVHAVQLTLSADANWLAVPLTSAGDGYLTGFERIQLDADLVAQSADSGQLWESAETAVVATAPFAGVSALVFGWRGAESETRRVVDQIDFVAADAGWAGAAYSFGEQESSHYVGDPVNAGTGNFVVPAMDLVFPEWVHGLSFGRFYNSLDESSGWLGRGWSSSFDVNVKQVGSDVALRQPDGQVRVFTALPGVESSWSTPEGLSASLRRDESTGQFVLEWSSGDRWTFGAGGWLVSIDGPAGQQVTVTRGAEGRVSSAAHSRNGAATGFGLTFSYDATSGLLTQVSAADGRVVDYGYTGGALTSVSDPHVSTDASWPVHTYGIDWSSGSPLVNQLAVTSSAAGSTPIVQLGLSYDGQGRVTSQTTDRGDVVTYTYAAGQTTVTNAASGDVTVETHDSRGRVTSIRDARGKTATRDWYVDGAPGGAVTGAPRSQSDRTGVGSGQFYDALGRIVQSVGPDPATGFVPKFTDATTTCTRFADGSFPAPGVSAGGRDCTGKAFTVTSYTYLSATDRRVASVTDPVGVVTSYDYGGTLNVLPSTVTVGTGPGAMVTAYGVSNNRIDWVEHGTGADAVRTCFDYDASTGALISQREACGTPLEAATTFTYTSLGQLATKTLPANGPTGQAARTWTYAWFGNGWARTETDPSGAVTGYTYDPDGQVASVTDPAGKVTTTTRAFGLSGTACGSVPATEQPCSTRTVSEPFDGATTRQSVTVYGRSGDVWETRAPGGATTKMTYGPLGRLLTSTDPTGVVTSYVYDDEGRVTDTFAGTDTSAAAADWSTHRTYDKAGRVISETAPADDTGRVTTTYAYDAAGRTTDTWVAKGTADEVHTSMTYWPNGLVKDTKVDRPDVAAGAQSVTTTSYDTAGRVTSRDVLVDDAGTHRVSTTTYDASGRPWRQSSPVADDPTTPAVETTATAQTFYWLDGSVRASQTPVQYANHPADDAAASAWRTEYSYDPAGRVIETRHPSPADGAVVSTRSCWSNRGELLASIDEAGSVTAYSYFDQANLVKTVTDPLGMNPAPASGCGVTPINTTQKRGVTTFGYDLRGNRTSRTVRNDAYAADLVESWTYDLADRPLTYTDQLSRQWSWSYPVSAGRQTTTVATSGDTFDAADPTGSSLRKTTTVAFASGRTASVSAQRFATNGTTVSESWSATSTYDAAGRRSSVTENPGGGVNQHVYRWTYNPVGQMMGSVWREGEGSQRTLGFGWDLAGDRTRVTYPDGVVYLAGFDAGGRLASVSGANGAMVVEYGYDVSGVRVSESLGGGAVGFRAWESDPRSGVVRRYVNVVDGTTRASVLGYNEAGQVSSDCRPGSVPGSAAQVGLLTCGSSDPMLAYSYDEAGQVLSASWSNVVSPPMGVWSWEFSYGNRGNRVAQRVQVDPDPQMARVVADYVWDDAGELTSVSGAGGGSYGYDEAGRRLSWSPVEGSGVGYGYGPRGELVSVAGPVVQSRHVDPDGRVDQVSFDGLGVIGLLWDPAGGGVDQIGEMTWDGGPFLRSVQGATRVRLDDPPGSPPGWLEDPTGGPPGWLAYDVAGSVLATVSGWGGPGDYDPFGQPDQPIDPIGFGYRGELVTGGLVHLRARDYDPISGTFLTRDPLDGVTGTTTIANPYAYAYNDPINRQDPTGLRPNDDAFDVATTVPPDPTCPDGQSVLSTPGSPSQHRSSYQICGSPDTSDGFVEVVNWLARWNKSAALLAFHANLLLYTSSPLNEGLAYRQAKVAIRSGAALRICAEDGTSVGGGHGAIRTHVMCLWNVPRFAVGAFIVNADALAYTQGHYVFCKAKENCGSPSDLRYPNQLAHELVHVRQWETYGDAFAGMYLGEEARGNSGQCKNPYEREAYDVAPIDSDGKLRCQK